MKLREYEAKNVLKAAGIPVPAGFLIRSADELTPRLEELGTAFVLKAQVDVGGRGKAGGILMADKATGLQVAKELFGQANSRSSSSPMPAGWKSRSPQKSTRN